MMMTAGTAATAALSRNQIIEEIFMSISVTITGIESSLWLTAPQCGQAAAVSLTLALHS